MEGNFKTFNQIRNQHFASYTGCCFVTLIIVQNCILRKGNYFCLEWKHIRDQRLLGCRSDQGHWLCFMLFTDGRHHDLIRRPSVWIRFTTIHYVCLFVFGATAPSGPRPPHSRGFYIKHKDAPQSEGLLWTSDQLVAETSIWRHTILTRDKHLFPRWDSNNPRSQQTSGRRPTPLTARPLGSASIT